MSTQVGGSAMTDRVVIPFRLDLEPMVRLFVATFIGDPEYEALEPQLFDDPRHGSGLAVLRYRRDGLLDVYHGRGLRLDRSAFAIGEGIGDWEETDFRPGRFAIGGCGIDVDVGFVDRQGRRVELRVVEHASGKRGVRFLAPVGEASRHPDRLFLVYMPGFDLVRREGTDVHIAIGDRRPRPATFPVTVNWHRVWFMRYAPTPVIAILNPPDSRPMTVSTSSSHDISPIVALDGERRVRKLGFGNGLRYVEIGFEPAFGGLDRLASGESITGRWSLAAAGDRVTGGTYRADRRSDDIEVEIDVTDPWKPVGLPFTLSLMTRYKRTFRTWPTTYRWQGVVRLGDTPAMSGRWEQTG